MASKSDNPNEKKVPRKEHHRGGSKVRAHEMRVPTTASERMAGNPPPVPPVPPVGGGGGGGGGFGGGDSFSEEELNDFAADMARAANTAQQGEETAVLDEVDYETGEVRISYVLESGNWQQLELTFPDDADRDLYSEVREAEKARNEELLDEYAEGLIDDIDADMSDAEIEELASEQPFAGSWREVNSQMTSEGDRVGPKLAERLIKLRDLKHADALDDANSVDAGEWSTEFEADLDYAYDSVDGTYSRTGGVTATYDGHAVTFAVSTDENVHGVALDAQREAMWLSARDPFGVEVLGSYSDLHEVRVQAFDNYVEQELIAGGDWPAGVKAEPGADGSNSSWTLTSGDGRTARVVIDTNESWDEDDFRREFREAFEELEVTSSI